MQSCLLCLFLLLPNLVAFSLAQWDPVRDFCRRFGHQSAVVDSKLYVDGGFVNWKPFTETSQNLTNPFLVFSDLDDSAQGMPTLHANLSKNATIPSVHGGALWDDSVNKRLYLFGGETTQGLPTNFVLYSYDILHNHWHSLGPPTGPVIPTSYGAGVSIPSRGEAYYYGGWFNNASVPGWTGPPLASNRLIKYTMDSNTWSNLTGPDTVRRADGVMVFIPIADAGMLVYFGGSKDLYGNGTLTPEPLDTIFLYDVANGKWYAQKTSGRTPESRRRFCAGATWAQDQSSYNIYLYGGAGFPPDTTGYDDIYVLSIPSFQWIRGPYPLGSNVTGPYPKSMMTCNVVRNAQMLIIGGTYFNNTDFMCDAESVWGQHNMALSQENPDNDIWGEYIPSVTTYTVPSFILTAVGGDKTGGATATKPASGFVAPELTALMTRKAVITPRSPTRSIPTPAPTQSNPGNETEGPAPVLSTGAIAGIAIGGFFGLLALVASCCLLVRRRQVYYANPRQDGQSVPSEAWGTSIPSVFSPAVSTQATTYVPPVQSPILLPSSPIYPRAELATDYSQRYAAWARSMPGSPVGGAKREPSFRQRSQSVTGGEGIPHHMHPGGVSPRTPFGGSRGPVPGAPFWAPPSPQPPAYVSHVTVQTPQARFPPSHSRVPVDQDGVDEIRPVSASHQGSIM